MSSFFKFPWIRGVPEIFNIIFCVLHMCDPADPRNFRRVCVGIGTPWTEKLFKFHKKLSIKKNHKLKKNLQRKPPFNRATCILIQVQGEPAQHADNVPPLEKSPVPPCLAILYAWKDSRTIRPEPGTGRPCPRAYPRFWDVSRCCHQQRFFREPMNGKLVAPAELRIFVWGINPPSGMMNFTIFFLFEVNTAFSYSRKVSNAKKKTVRNENKTWPKCHPEGRQDSSEARSVERESRKVYRRTSQGFVQKSFLFCAL